MVITCLKWVLDDMANIRPCIGCAACCYLQVELEREIDDVPEHLTCFRGSRLFMKRESDRGCVALDRNNLCCTIYENRPLECKQFERGKLGCRGAIFMIYRDIEVLKNRQFYK